MNIFKFIKAFFDRFLKHQNSEWKYCVRCIYKLAILLKKKGDKVLVNQEKLKNVHTLLKIPFDEIE